MSKGNSGKDVFHELEIQNPAVAQVFRTFRRYGEQHKDDYHFGDDDHVVECARCAALPRRYLIASFLLLIGSIGAGIAIGPIVVRFLEMHWHTILLPVSGACIGSGVILLVTRIETSPLHTVAPPKVDTDDPLQELRELAERTASRLRSAYRLQLWIVLAVGTIFIALIVWSMVMVSQERILYASAFGSSSVAMMILTQWKWQPFDRINSARQLADNADTLATGLRMRMKTISEIVDPSERAKAQWNAVKEYLERS